MRHYLDHAATTPCAPRSARDAWLAASETVGNASSTHGAGQDARRLLEESRGRVAALVDADPIRIVFTSGGTESINLALQGLWHARPPGSSAIVLPDGEHHATMDTVAALVDEDRLRRVLVTPEARIDPEEFAACCGAALATALAA